MINYNAALPPLPFMGKSSINVNNWMGEIKGNLTYLVRSIFSKGEQGFAYDPNDLTTLYQDAAGTIPVTAQGQPVGLMLDKSKSLTLGAELNTNKFTTNLTGWAEPVAGSAVIEEGEAKITFKGALENTSANWFRFIGTYKAGKRLLVTFDATHVTGTGSLQVGSHYSPTLAITPASNGKIKKAYSAYCSAHENTTSAIVSFASTVSGDVWKISNVSVKEVLGNHAYQPVSASRPILQRNATTGAYYLAFDGVDDFLQTNNIDFTATDKVSLFAGLNVVAGAATGCVIEISTSANGNNGSFGLFKGPAAIQWASRGTMGNLGAQYALPVYPDVLCAKAAINTPLLTVRRNAILNIDDNRTQGTGNYGNYPLYIGRRAGTSLPFGGHIYGLIGTGKLTSDNETVAIEKELAKRTGVTLNV